MREGTFSPQEDMFKAICVRISKLLDSVDLIKLHDLDSVDLIKLHDLCS